MDEQRPTTQQTQSSTLTLGTQIAEQTTPTLLDVAAAASIQAMLGTEAPPTREALALLIQENTALIASGDGQAMAAALSRQSTALEIGMHGLLSAMSRATNPEHRLTLAKAAATLHRACLSALSAVHQIRP